MSILWNNSSKSGLCDRLIDTFLMGSMAKLYNMNLYLCWFEQPITDLQKKIWNPIRINDYKIENVKEYFNLPNVLNIVSEQELNILIENSNHNDIIFRDYLGGIYSPYTFYNRYINNKFSLDEYLNSFKITIHNFIPKQNLIGLMNYLPNDLITIHLRRTDKSSELVSCHEAHGVNYNDIHNLDRITSEVIDKLINKGFNNIYFASDCDITKNQYSSQYKDKCSIFNYSTGLLNKDIEKTYLDIYAMSISKYIILSQRHSSFSLFCSMINQSTLIYLYDDDMIKNNNYEIMGNIIYYKNLDF